MIGEYQFGLITINGKTYNYDVEVRWNGEVLKWWRRESHLIEIDDLKRAVNQKPDIIVIGTGESGIAKVTRETQKFIEEEGIQLIIDKTGEAVKVFNKILEKLKEKEDEKKKIIGLFHLTC